MKTRIATEAALHEPVRHDGDVVRRGGAVDGEQRSGEGREAGLGGEELALRNPPGRVDGSRLLGVRRENGRSTLEGALQSCR